MDALGLPYIIMSLINRKQIWKKKLKIKKENLSRSILVGLKYIAFSFVFFFFFTHLFEHYHINCLQNILIVNLIDSV